MSYDRIFTFNVSVVRINGKIIVVGAPTESPEDVLFRNTNLTLTSPYGRSCEVMIGLIRVELHCTHHDWHPLQRFKNLSFRTIGFVTSINECPFF